MIKQRETIEESTLQMFEKYVTLNEIGQLDATMLFSLQCYNEWLNTRKTYPKNPPEAFRKMITGHCRGDSGLLPFQPQIEKAVVFMLRRRRVWECFRGTGVKVGLRGFKTKGYWEKLGKTGNKRKWNEEVEFEKILEHVDKRIKVEDVNNLFLNESYTEILSDEEVINLLDVDCWG